MGYPISLVSLHDQARMTCRLCGDERMMSVRDLSCEEIKNVVHRALAEDVGDGDITTSAIVPEVSTSTARVVFREAGIMAGLAVAREVFAQLDHEAELDSTLVDGSLVEAGETVAMVSASTRALLTGERVALNFLQRLSGIATITRAYVHAVAGTGVRILDTRKTTPTVRMLEKYAVCIGGGVNHRYGLYDAVLIKDNHIAAAGGLSTAVMRVRGASPPGTVIQVEVESTGEVPIAVAAGADALLLDNMTPESVAQSVAIAGRNIRVEASGGITLVNVRAFAETGVDDISIGALTHSAPALDIGLDM